MTTISAEEFARRYGGAEAAPITLSADEFAKKYGNVPRGTPTEEPGPFRRFLQGAGIPTSTEEMKNVAEGLDPSVQIMRGNPLAVAGPVGLAAGNLVHAVGQGIGTQAGEALDAAQHGDVGGYMKHALGAAVPLVGPQAAEGNIAGAAGTVTSLLAPPMAGRAIGRVLEAAGDAQKAPLSESIGSQIAAKSGKIFNPQETVVVDKFGSAKAQASQLQALAEKYPNATVYDDGDTFRVEANRPAVKPAGGTPRQGGHGVISAINRHPIAATVGGGIGFVHGHGFGAFIGAEGGAMAADAVQRMVNSPFWRVTSGTLKQAVGKAMAAEDFPTVSDAASRVLGGEGLQDEYGHDNAVWSLIQDAMQRGGNEPLDRTLSDYDAVYTDEYGNSVQVPHHIMRQLRDAFTK